MSQDFDKSLQKLKFLFKCSGLTLESRKIKRKTKYINRCVFLFNFFCLNSDVLGAIFWFIDGIKTGKTFVELTYAAPCITFSFLGDIKALFLMRYEDHVCDLIDNLRQLQIDANNIRTKEKIAIQKEETKFLHVVLKSSNILNAVLLITFSVSPFILIAVKYFNTNELDLILPFMIVYPFDSHDIRFWPFVYLHQFWSVCVVLLNFCAADFLLYTCCTYLRVQFRLLRHDLELVVETCSRRRGDDEVFEEKCIRLVKWHQELIRLSNMLELIYAKSTLFNFVSSSILICLTGFNVIAIENVAFAVTFLVFLTASLLQIYLLCFFGDLLMKSSMGVSDGVYNSKWYYLLAKSGKNLIIVQTRAQKPCKLTAYGFSDVNLRSFMSILSSAWSYFALLKTVYSPPKK